MRLKELCPQQAETLRFKAKDILTGRYLPLANPPTPSQLHSLRLEGIILGPDQEVLRYSFTGKLRECVHGIPCRYECGGFMSGACKEKPAPDCGIGECLLLGKPCHSSCDHEKNLANFVNPS